MQDQQQPADSFTITNYYLHISSNLLIASSHQTNTHVHTSNFSVCRLPLQFIKLFDEVSGSFLFSNKLFPKHSLCPCLSSGRACQDTNILQKMSVAVDLGVDLAMGEAKGP